ncbi:centrosome and spindle pole-associated protein 1 isoform X2 [Pyxicephalus adspersus]|uniref:centrosome and spindle pole-associated protein 1 isoform X2 n=1 Tax=Pyxicephalus adspersus TaxID=30357 RepID=UPI003B5AB080
MGEDLDLFIEEQKAKLAQDKAALENDPPYMDIGRFDNTHDADGPRVYASKENIPPKRNSQKETAPVKQSEDASYGLSLPLGEEYERKKHKLKEELRQDYRKYLNQGNAQAKRKKYLISTGEVDPATQGLSLPIGERLSAKERLRLERNREYNQFLRMKADEQAKYRLTAQYNTNDETQSRLKTDQYPDASTSHRDQYLSKKDAHTSTEDFNFKRRPETERSRRRDFETEDQIVRRLEEDAIISSKKPWKSEIDADRIDRPRYIDADYERERRPLRLTFAAEKNEPLSYRGRYDEEDRRPMRHNPFPERVLPLRGDVLETHEYIPDQALYFQTARGDQRDKSLPRPNVENQEKITGRAKSANNKEEDFSTGLLLGGSDKDDAQKRRKERYRQELMEQMAEQQRNKRREKELGLKVAASGAIDPEKQPDRLRQFGAINRHQEIPDRNVPFRSGVLIDSETSVRRIENKSVVEEKAPPERVRVAFQTPVPDPAVNASGYPVAFNPVQEDFHRGLSSALGEIVVPRIAAVPPPQPVVLADNYRTPYDDAYYYYGARNPLDPNLAHYPVGSLGVQAAPGVNLSSMYPIPAHPQDHTTYSKQRAEAAKGASLGVFPEEKAQKDRKVAQNYQEELEQQIRERNEKRRKEKEEQERYESKLEAEMRSYNPWGKGGGGAPLKDEKGNLITDLKHMHKQNESAYQNPKVRDFEDNRAVVAVDTSLADNTSSTGKIPGFSFANPSQFARGSVFNEPVTEEKVHQQESYKNFLRQQIDEKRRKEAEEKERIRLEEEREEKRLAEQRAKIQREYEEEQNRKKLKEEEQRQKNEELVRLADERRKEAERRRKEDETKQEEELKRFYEQQKAADETEEKEFQPPRQPSPVIPALQHKLSSQTPRPPSAKSEVSIQSYDEPQPRAASPPVPARRNQLRAFDEKKNVINQLSELRKQLRSEQRRLESRLQDTDRDDESLPSRSGRRREKSADIFDIARQGMQAKIQRPFLKNLESINMQNIQEFNDLKYRDTETREGVRFMYPDPPKDDQTLDIQQQALLRVQQRNLKKLKRRPGMPDGFDPFPEYSRYHAEVLKDPTKELLKTSLLESESVFIGENGEPYATFADLYPDMQPLSTARERRRRKQHTVDFDSEIPTVPPLPLNKLDTFSVNSASSFNVEELQSKNEERLRKLSNLQRSTVSTDPDGFGNADDLLKRYPPKFDRPQSVDTVATEPWMRPGTSETLKRFMDGQMNREKSANENALTFNWQGLSTAHG